MSKKKDLICYTESVVTRADPGIVVKYRWGQWLYTMSNDTVLWEERSQPQRFQLESQHSEKNRGKMVTSMLLLLLRNLASVAAGMKTWGHKENGSPLLLVCWTVIRESLLAVLCLPKFSCQLCQTTQYLTNNACRIFYILKIYSYICNF